MQRHWRAYRTQAASGGFRREARFLPYLFDELLFGERAAGEEDEVLEGRLLELCCDLLGQHATRRFFRLFAADRVMAGRLTLRQGRMSATNKRLAQMVRLRRREKSLI